MGCHFLLQGIVPTQGSNLGLPHCRQMLYRLSYQGSHMSVCGVIKGRRQGQRVKIKGAGVLFFHFSRGLELVYLRTFANEVFCLDPSLPVSSSFLPSYLLSSFRAQPHITAREGFSGPGPLEETKVRLLLSHSTSASLLY